MLAATGMRKYFCSTSGGMSMPPVEPPTRITMPSAPPMPSPAKMVHRNRSSVRTYPANSRSHTARVRGDKKVLARVERAKRRPSSTQPASSMATLTASSTPDTGTPVRRLAARAMPVAPPVMRPEGIRKRTTVREYSALPASRARAVRARRPRSLDWIMADTSLVSMPQRKENAPRPPKTAGAGQNLLYQKGQPGSRLRP